MASYLHDVAFVDAIEMRTLGSCSTWNPAGDQAAPPAAFPGYARYQRMDLASRFVATAGTLLPPIPPSWAASTAVVLGTVDGSLDVDRAFAASISTDRPAPALYARTLPSIPGAELATMLGLHGPNWSIVQRDEPVLLAIAAAHQEIVEGACAAAFAGGYGLSSAGDPGDRWAVLVLLAAEPAARAPAWKVDVRRRPGPFAPRASRRVIDVLRDLAGGVGTPPVELAGATPGGEVVISISPERRAPR